MRRPGPRVALVLSAALLLMLSALPAQAGGFGIGTPLPTRPPAVSSGPRAPVATDPGPSEASTPRCRMYGSANGFGMVCLGGGDVQASLLALLGGRPLQGCYDAPATFGFVPPRTDAGKRWWLRTCLTGLDLSSLRRLGQIGVTFTYVQLPAGAEMLLREPDKTVWDHYAKQGQIPFPLLGASPTSSPRVGTTTSFALRNELETPHVRTGDVEMWAEVVQLQVDPGDGGAGVACDDGGEVLTAEQVDGADPQDPTLCLHTYERSSQRAGAGADRYRAEATAVWRIFYDGGGGPQVLGTYEKKAQTELRVTELQTLNVR